MLKSKLNQYNYIIEGMTTDEREETIQRVQDYYVSQNNDFTELTKNIATDVNTYKALRNDMNEVDDNNFTATVDFENSNNKNVVLNAGKYDGSSNLVGIADIGGNINYDPKKHIIEIASPVYMMVIMTIFILKMMYYMRKEWMQLLLIMVVLV